MSDPDPLKVRVTMTANLLVDDPDQRRCCWCFLQQRPGVYWEDGFFACVPCLETQLNRIHEKHQVARAAV